jgi:hypothetical protein
MRPSTPCQSVGCARQVNGSRISRTQIWNQLCCKCYLAMNTEFKQNLDNYLKNLPKYFLAFEELQINGNVFVSVICSKWKVRRLCRLTT